MSTRPNFATWPLDGIALDRSRLGFAVGEQSIRESLWNILVTTPGERLMRPEFGAGIQQFVHEPDTEGTRKLIASVVTRAIERWEPRVILEDVDVVSGTPGSNRVHLLVRYRARHDQQRSEFDLSLDLQP